MTKPSCKKIKEMILDEKAGSKEYKKYGFKILSHAEKRHSIILKHKLKRCKK
jgi:hypothetical protein